MASEMLSQEEIDALLKDDSSELTSAEEDALGEIGNIAFGSGSTALSLLLNRRVELNTPTVDVTNMKQLIDDHPTPCVCAEVDYLTGLKGSNLLLVEIPDAAIIADLMLGGDGIDPKMKLGEMELSAIGEAMNQMIGKASTAMSSMFDMRVEIAPPKTSILDLNDAEQVNELFSEDSKIVRIHFRLIIEGLVNSKIMLIIPYGFAREMALNLIKKGSDGQDEEAVRQAQVAASASIPEMAASMPGGGGPQTVQPVQFGPITPSSVPRGGGNLNLLLDVPLQVSVELGNTRMKIKDILDLGIGSVIELDRLAGEPVDILVNGKLIAKGEVVVIDENFGVKITDIVSPLERVNNLQ
ncbi:MAG TPA: flagellar motor switch phosphatase FliY [Bacillota bacterium]